MLFRKVVELEPSHADSWFNLAFSMRNERRYEEAVEAYGRALELGISGPEEILVNRALIFSDHLYRTDLAEIDLQQALEISPGFVPALINLGMLQEDLGEREAAIETYSLLIERSPANGRARARLAALATDPDSAIQDLSSALVNIPMQSEDLAEVEFALGNLLDQVERYDDAFAIVDRANRRMASLRPSHLRYDARAHERMVAALIDAYPVRPSLSATSDGERIIFVCGMFRSGSTVTEQVLARHPAIVAGGELEHIPAFVADFLQPYPQAALSLDNSQLFEMRKQYSKAIERQNPDARYVTDKRPDNFFHLGLIKTLFPAARILHTMRNPLDVLISTYFLNFAQTVSYSESLDAIAHYLAQYRRLSGHWEKVFGDDICVVDYDRLVRHADAEIDQVYCALGLKPIEAAERPDRFEEAVIRTPSAWQARSPLHARSSGRWRNYERFLEPYLFLMDL